MGVVLNTDMSAIAARNNLTKSQGTVEKAMERLSSGLRINRAADDASGLAISENLRAQTNGLKQAVENARNGVSIVKTADGGLNETHAALQRMRTLAVQAANGSNSPDNLRQIQTEMNQLMAQIDDIADGGEFNGMKLLDGTFVKKQLQIGANAGDTMQIDIYSRHLDATPAIPAVPPQPAKRALWDVNKHLPAADQTVSLQQTVGGSTTSVSLTIPTPGPASIDELADILRNDPGFDAAFTVQVTSYNTKAGSFPDANLIFESRTPGAGEVTISGIGSSWQQVDRGFAGSPEIPEKPERYLGYHAAEILDAGIIDVTRQGGSYTSPGYTTTTGGEYTGFGIGDYEPTATYTVPPSTTTWGSGASDAIGMIDRAIAIVSRGRGDLGAYENRLKHAIRGDSVSAQNMAASESRIRDADMAEEMAELTRGQVIAQAGVAMLAQANQMPQSVLKLLG